MTQAPARDGSTLPLADALSFNAAMRQLAEAPPVLEESMRQIGEEQRKAAGVQGVHVVYIDDLDRCSTQFTVDVLASTTFWATSEQDNVYFVLAASREHLLDSLRENLPLGVRYPEQALEKYVHLGLNLPAFLNKPAEVHAYYGHLLARIGTSADVEPERLAEFSEIFAAGMDDYPRSAVAPLLRCDASLTPRSAKSRLNTFLAEFRPAGTVTESQVKPRSTDDLGG